MNRPILVSALLLMATAALGAQQASDSNPYEGTSTPPSDDSIVTTTSVRVKPPASHTSAPARYQAQAQEQDQIVSANSSDPDSDIVTSASVPEEEPTLTRRSQIPDPDGDIVHPRALRPGELPEGVTIRVELLDQLSTASSEKGEAFRSRVASDVLQGGQVLIPAGAEIDGQVSEVSSGHPGGHGSMRLRPEKLILPDGTRYQLHAYLTGTPGAKSKVGSEGKILPGSRMKRDGIEYGGGVGAGVVGGAMVAGPVGAMTGGIIGASVITTHLMVSHPQATLEAGTVLLLTLSQPLQLSAVGSRGN
jgi:hypothetical protein